MTSLSRRVALATLLATALSPLAAHPDFTPSPVRVQITGQPGSWQLLRDGQPFFIHGGGGDGDYAHFARIGGNAVRTYSARDVDDQLQRARAAGLAILFGHWIGHERHGFDYSDPAALERQRRDVVEAVLTHRDNPDIIMWAVGNEMEGDGTNLAIWREINHLARLIKELDDRPVTTILAGASPVKLEAVRDHCPDLDLLSINTYAGLPGVHERMLRHGPSLPYLITEFGAHGPWERPRTPWGVELEQTSTEKSEIIHRNWEHHIAGRAGHCLGGFVFRWGWKQEATHTWFGLFLDDGSPVAPVDALQKVWTGSWPATRSPQIEPLALPALSRALRPGQRVPVTVRATSDHPLTYEWRVYEESRDRRSGGDREARPDHLPSHVENHDHPRATLLAPTTPGRYRLFITIRDPQGRVATHNLPFLVE